MAEDGAERQREQQHERPADHLGVRYAPIRRRGTIGAFRGRATSAAVSTNPDKSGMILLAQSAQRGLIEDGCVVEGEQEEDQFELLYARCDGELRAGIRARR